MHFQAKKQDSRDVYCFANHHDRTTYKVPFKIQCRLFRSLTSTRRFVGRQMASQQQICFLYSIVARAPPRFALAFT